MSDYDPYDRDSQNESNESENNHKAGDISIATIKRLAIGVVMVIVIFGGLIYYKEVERTSPRQPKVQLAKPIELLDLKLRRDPDSSFYIITGIVVNNSPVAFRYVSVTFNYYNRDGARIGNTLDNISDFRPGQKWQLKITVLDKDVDRVEVGDIIKY